MWYNNNLFLIVGTDMSLTKNELHTTLEQRLRLMVEIERPTADIASLIEQANALKNEPFWYNLVIAIVPKNDPDLLVVKLKKYIQHGLNFNLKTSGNHSIFSVCWSYKVPLDHVHQLLELIPCSLKEDEFYQFMRSALLHNPRKEAFLHKLATILPNHLPGQSALKVFIRNGFPQLLERLMSVHPVDIKDHTAEELFSCCVGHKNTDMLEWLYSQGVEATNFDREEFPPEHPPAIFLALTFRNDKIVRWLLSSDRVNLNCVYHRNSNDRGITITEYLINLESINLIIDFNLLKRTNNLSDNCLWDIETIFNSQTLDMPRKVEFADYLLNYFSSTPSDLDLFPEFGCLIEFCLSHTMLLEENASFCDSPLLHFLEHTFFSYCRDVQKTYVDAHSARLWYEAKMHDIITKFDFDLNIKDHDGVTLLAKLIYQEEEGFQRMQWLMSQHGLSQTNLDNVGSSLLHLACQQENLALVVISIKNGHNRFKPRKDGLDAVDIALLTENIEILEYLIKPEHRQKLIKKNTWKHLDEVMKAHLLPCDTTMTVPTVASAVQESVVEEDITIGTQVESSSADEAERFNFFTTLNWDLLIEKAHNPNWIKKLKRFCMIYDPTFRTNVEDFCN
jgi:hypothetical protein